MVASQFVYIITMQDSRRLYHKQRHCHSCVSIHNIQYKQSADLHQALWGQIYHSQNVPV